jgi:hypothetical protein
MAEAYDEVPAIRKWWTEGVGDNAKL